MQFRTTIDIKPFEQRIDHTQPILSLGSCFADNIAKRLTEAKFQTVASPTGTLFNPESIAAALNRFDALSRGDKGVLPAAEELSRSGSRWFSYDFHSDFSSSDARKALSAMQTAVERGAEALSNAKVVIVTFGTAFVYRHKCSGEVVANCHKQPQSLFLREMLSADEIASRYISLLQGPLADKQVIFTISPVRHLSDGLEANSLSKATLRIAVERIKQDYSNAIYFPAYEIVMDELRDYRFYAEDMTHPSSVAVDYIWQRFAECAFSAQTLKTNEQIERIIKATHHRPFDAGSDEHKAFCRTMIEKCEQIERLYGPIEMTEEKEFFNTYL